MAIKSNRIGVVIGAENEYSKELKDAKQEFGAFNKDIAAGFMVAAKTAAVAAAAVIGAGTALFALTSRYASAGDALGDFNARIGVGVEALSEWQYIADISGISAETLNMAWQRMTRRLAEAAVGTGEAQGALKELGLSAVELAQLAPEDQFDTIATALDGVKEKSHQVRLAMKFFDSEGVAVLQTLGNIERGKKGVRESGQIWTAEEVALAAEFSVVSKEASGALSGLGKSIAIDLMPGFTSLLTGTADFINNSPALGGAIDLVTLAVTGLAGALGFDTDTEMQKIEKMQKQFLIFQSALITNAPILAAELEKPYIRQNHAMVKAFKAQKKENEFQVLSLGNQIKFRMAAVVATHAAAAATGEQTGKTKIQTAEEKKKAAAVETASKAIDALRLSTSKLGATEEELIQIDVAEFEARGASSAQVIEYTVLLEKMRAKKKEISDQTETDRQNEAAAQGLAGIGAAPELMDGAGAPDQFAEFEQMQTRLQAIQDFHGQKITLMAAAGATEQQLLAEQHAGEIAQEKQKHQMKLSLAQGTFGMMSNMMQNLTVLTGKEGGAAFKAMKAFAIAETTIQTYRAAQGAYASMSLINPALGIAAAAAATLSGLARVKQIASMQPGGSATGTTISPGGTANPSYSGGSPSAYPVPERAEQARERPTIVFRIESMHLLDENSVGLLMERMSVMVKEYDFELTASETVAV